MAQMGYKLRFVQRFKPDCREAFLALERQFKRLEESSDRLPRGKRYLPYSGREPVNTLIWECDFATLAEAQNALEFLEQNEGHENLYQQQVRYFLEAYTEIYQLFD